MQKQDPPPPSSRPEMLLRINKSCSCAMVLFLRNNILGIRGLQTLQNFIYKYRDSAYAEARPTPSFVPA